MSIKKKLLGFFASVAKKQETKATQAEVMKYVEVMDNSYRDYGANGCIQIECPYCKFPQYFQPNPASKWLPGKQFKTAVPADFVEHLVQVHSKDMTTGKLLFEILFLETIAGPEDSAL